MNKPLMMVLVASLTATLWAATHEGGETVEAVKSSGASASPARAISRPAPESRGAREHAVPDRMAAASQPNLNLAQDIAAWKQREPIGLKPQGELKAWGPSLPPPPPPPPVSKQVAHVEPPSPQAPRFPHQWVGRFNDMAVVSGPQQTWVVAAGQVIDGQWRIDQIRDRQMQLTYLPFKQAQTVAMRTP
ncbi:MAG: hypothetical protein KGL57_07930 [Burkholderiales bacterium]|nr:hypothetical protein [Burkholderiales bacterium]